MPDQRPAHGEGRGDPARLDRATDATTGADARLTRRLAIGALAVALVALGSVGLALARSLPSTTDSCQTTAWNAVPAATDLPAGWSETATQYDVERMTMTLLGPTPQDQASARAVIYATVTCYPTDAADAVTRSQAAASAAGQTVSSRSDLGDQGFTALDPSGAAFIQFRRGDVVAYVAASGDATAAEVEAVASAFDRALGGNGSTATIPTPAPSTDASPSPSEPAPASSSPSASVSPSTGAAAPELEAALPTTVAGTTLTIDSAVGSSVLGNDAGSRAIGAALRAEGRSPDDFEVAEAYDATGSIDLSVYAFRVTGMAGDALRKIVLDTWLSAGGAGVTTSTATLGDRAFTRVDYGDGGIADYVATDRDMVIVIETADASLAAEAAAALP